jgi:hypothetical protein
MTQSPRRAFVVAHYDPAGRVAWNLRDLVAHLATLGRVIFVSTNLDENAARSLPAGVQVITRPNEGYDFYSYKRGIEALGDPRAFDEVVILNSSFVCLDPARLTGRFFSARAPTWTCSDSHPITNTRPTCRATGSPSGDAACSIRPCSRNGGAIWSPSPIATW